MIIKTTAPIDLDDLKKYFVDKSINYLIDYSNSQLQGTKLLTYISNLDLPIDIEVNIASPEGAALLKDYMETSILANVPSLEKAAFEKLYRCRFDMPDDFTKNNQDILDHWLMMIDSLTIYNMYIVQDQKMQDYAKSYPHYETDVIKGINYVQLLKYEQFYTLYEKHDKTNLKFMPGIFDGPVFKGKELYRFWANENNPMFMLTYGISSNSIDKNEYIEAKKASIKDIENVTSV